MGGLLLTGALEFEPWLSPAAQSERHTLRTRLRSPASCGTASCTHHSSTHQLPLRFSAIPGLFSSFLHTLGSREVVPVLFCVVMVPSLSTALSAVLLLCVSGFTAFRQNPNDRIRGFLNELLGRGSAEYMNIHNIEERF